MYLLPKGLQSPSLRGQFSRVLVSLVASEVFLLRDKDYDPPESESLLVRFSLTNSIGLCPRGRKQLTKLRNRLMFRLATIEQINSVERKHTHTYTRTGLSGRRKANICERLAPNDLVNRRKHVTTRLVKDIALVNIETIHERPCTRSFALFGCSYDTDLGISEMNTAPLARDTDLPCV